MWSTEPLEPPPHDTAPGFASSRAVRSATDLIGEAAPTTTISVSAYSRAIGVAFFSVTGGLLLSIAPTITEPTTISAAGLLFSELTNWASAIVPPAPPLLS